MSDGIYVALGGAVAQQRSLDVVANNVANASTTGFQADRVAFAEAVSAASGGRTALPPSVAVSAIRPDLSPGALEATGNPLDVALQGDGWLAIRTPNGERYTRAGSLLLDRDGVLRTHAGHAVLDTDRQPIVLPRNQPIEFAPDGTIRADGSAVAQLRVVRFQDPRSLVKEGLTFYTTAPGTRATAATDTTIVQGYLESANVNVMGGMNELINAGRAFDAFQRVIHGFSQIDERTARDIGSPE